MIKDRKAPPDQSSASTLATHGSVGLLRGIGSTFTPSIFRWKIRAGQAFKETKQALIASGAEIVSEQLANGRFSIAYRTGRQKLTPGVSADDGLRLSVKERHRV